MIRIRDSSLVIYYYLQVAFDSWLIMKRYVSGLENCVDVAFLEDLFYHSLKRKRRKKWSIWKKISIFQYFLTPIEKKNQRWYVKNSITHVDVLYRGLPCTYDAMMIDWWFYQKWHTFSSHVNIFERVSHLHLHICGDVMSCCDAGKKERRRKVKDKDVKQQIIGNIIKNV